MNWYLEALKKYVVFSGRARRKEFWYFILFSTIINMVLAFFNSSGTLSAFYSLAVFLPSIAVFVRRLHDTDRSGWWILIGLIPVIGAIVLLVFSVLNGTPDANRYGEDPKGVAA